VAATQCILLGWTRRAAVVQSEHQNEEESWFFVKCNKEWRQFWRQKGVQ